MVKLGGGGEEWISGAEKVDIEIPFPEEMEHPWMEINCDHVLEKKQPNKKPKNIKKAKSPVKFQSKCLSKIPSKFPDRHAQEPKTLIIGSSPQKRKPPVKVTQVTHKGGCSVRTKKLNRRQGFIENGNTMLVDGEPRHHLSQDNLQGGLSPVVYNTKIYPGIYPRQKPEEVEKEKENWKKPKKNKKTKKINRTEDDEDWEKLLKLISPDNFPNWEIVKRRRPPFAKRSLRIHNKGHEVRQQCNG